MLLLAIVIVLLVAFVLWYAGGPWDEGWTLKNDNDYEIRSLYKPEDWR